MHSSDNTKMRNKIKKIGLFFAAAAIVCGILYILDMALYPCTFIRNDMHQVMEEYHDDVILGTSHGKMNIDPEVISPITGRSIHNMSAGGEYARDAYYIAKLLAAKQKPKRILLEVDPGYLMSSKAKGNNELLFLHEFPFGPVKMLYFIDSMGKSDFRSALFPWYEYPLSYELKHAGETWRRKWTKDYGVSYFEGKAQRYHASGWIEKFDTDLAGQSPKEPEFFKEEKLTDENVTYLRKLIRLCKKEGIDLIAVVTPLPEQSLAMGEQYDRAYERIGQIFSDEEVRVWNFNTELYDSFSHEIDYFTDFDGHMNKKGAQAFSAVLGRMLKEQQDRSY